MAVRVDAVSLLNGIRVASEILEHRPAVAIVLFGNNGDVPLVNQFRYPVGEEFLEMPGDLETVREIYGHLLS